MSQFQNVKVVEGQANVIVDSGSLDIVGIVNQVNLPVRVVTDAGVPLQTASYLEGGRILYDGGGSALRDVNLQCILPIPVLLGSTPPGPSTAWIDISTTWNGTSNNSQTSSVPLPSATRTSMVLATNTLYGTSDLPYPTNPMVWRFNAYQTILTTTGPSDPLPLVAGRAYRIYTPASLPVQFRTGGGPWDTANVNTYATWYQAGANDELRVLGNPAPYAVTVTEFVRIDVVDGTGAATSANGPDFISTRVNGIVLAQRNQLQDTTNPSNVYRHIYSNSAPLNFNMVAGTFI